VAKARDPRHSAHDCRELHRNPLPVPPAHPGADPHLQAFVETYFSNYIEGTEFEIKEAHDIVVKGRPMKYREDDSHDIRKNG
jgi:hypothetical protein